MKQVLLTILVSAITSFLVTSFWFNHTKTESSENIAFSKMDDLSLAKKYCQQIGEELEEVRYNPHSYVRIKEYVCSQNIANRDKRGVWLSIQDIEFQLEFLASKKALKLKENKE